MHFEQFYRPTQAWAEVHAYPSREGISVYFRDITNRKCAEEALQRSESRLRVFYESDMVGTLFWDLSGRIIDANGKFLRTVGYTREELVNGGIGWFDLTPPEYRDLDAQAVAQLRATGVDTPYEKEFLRKDGRWVPVIVGAAMLDELEVGFVSTLPNEKRLKGAWPATSKL